MITNEDINAALIKLSDAIKRYIAAINELNELKGYTAKLSAATVSSTPDYAKLLDISVRVVDGMFVSAKSVAATVSFTPDYAKLLDISVRVVDGMFGSAKSIKSSPTNAIESADQKTLENVIAASALIVSNSLASSTPVLATSTPEVYDKLLDISVRIVDGMFVSAKSSELLKNAIAVSALIVSNSLEKSNSLASSTSVLATSTPDVYAKLLDISVRVVDGMFADYDDDDEDDEDESLIHSVSDSDSDDGQDIPTLELSTIYDKLLDISVRVVNGMFAQSNNETATVASTDTQAQTATIYDKLLDISVRVVDGMFAQSTPEIAPVLVNNILNNAVKSATIKTISKDFVDKIVENAHISANYKLYDKLLDISVRVVDGMFTESNTEISAAVAETSQTATIYDKLLDISVRVVEGMFVSDNDDLSVSSDSFLHNESDDDVSVSSTDDNDGDEQNILTPELSTIYDKLLDISVRVVDGMFTQSNTETSAAVAETSQTATIYDKLLDISVRVVDGMFIQSTPNKVVDTETSQTATIYDKLLDISVRVVDGMFTQSNTTSVDGAPTNIVQIKQKLNDALHLVSNLHQSDVNDLKTQLTKLYNNLNKESITDTELSNISRIYDEIATQLEKIVKENKKIMKESYAKILDISVRIVDGMLSSEQLPTPPGPPEIRPPQPPPPNQKTLPYEKLLDISVRIVDGMFKQPDKKQAWGVKPQLIDGNIANDSSDDSSDDDSVNSSDDDASVIETPQSQSSIIEKVKDIEFDENNMHNHAIIIDTYMGGYLSPNKHYIEQKLNDEPTKKTDDRDNYVIEKTYKPYFKKLQNTIKIVKDRMGEYLNIGLFMNDHTSNNSMISDTTDKNDYQNMNRSFMFMTKCRYLNNKYTSNNHIINSLNQDFVYVYVNEHIILPDKTLNPYNILTTAFYTIIENLKTIRQWFDNDNDNDYITTINTYINQFENYKEYFLKLHKYIETKYKYNTVDESKLKYNNIIDKLNRYIEEIIAIPASKINYSQTSKVVRKDNNANESDINAVYLKFLDFSVAYTTVYSNEQISDTRQYILIWFSVYLDILRRYIEEPDITDINQDNSNRVKLYPIGTVKKITLEKPPLEIQQHNNIDSDNEIDSDSDSDNKLASVRPDTAILTKRRNSGP